MTTQQTFQKDAAQALARAAELFGVLSTPLRLQIIRVLCGGERNVSVLLEQIQTSQSNMSRHLNVLYQAGVVARRRKGQQVFYRLSEDSAAMVCKVVCAQVDGGKKVRSLLTPQ